MLLLWFTTPAIDCLDENSILLNDYPPKSASKLITVMFNQDLHQTAGMLNEYLLILRVPADDGLYCIISRWYFQCITSYFIQIM